MKKILHIGLCVFNLLLIIDLIIINGILKQFNVLLPKSLLLFWINSHYWTQLNEFQIAFMYTDLIVKLLLLSFLIVAICRNVESKFNWILLRIVVLVYGISMIYVYIFLDFVLLQNSTLIKFIFICISILFLYKYFRPSLNKTIDSLYSIKISLYIIVLFLSPVLIFKTLNFYGKLINDRSDEISVINSLIKNERIEPTKEIILNSDVLLNFRTDFYKNASKENLSLLNKLFMYTQFDMNKVTQWSDDFENVRLVTLNNKTKDFSQRLDSLSKICNSTYEYFISKPIFNFNGDIAYVSVYTIFLPEPTGRYANYKYVFLEKINNEWVMKK